MDPTHDSNKMNARTAGHGLDRAKVAGLLVSRRYFLAAVTARRYIGGRDWDERSTSSLLIHGDHLFRELATRVTVDLESIPSLSSVASAGCYHDHHYGSYVALRSVTVNAAHI